MQGDGMKTPDWMDAGQFKAALVGDGWQSPDTYDKHFAPLVNIPV
jgi:hypothetical protein